MFHLSCSFLSNSFPLIFQNGTNFLCFFIPPFFPVFALLMAFPNKLKKGNRFHKRKIFLRRVISFLSLQRIQKKRNGKEKCRLKIVRAFSPPYGTAPQRTCVFNVIYIANFCLLKSLHVKRFKMIFWRHRNGRSRISIRNLILVLLIM